MTNDNPRTSIDEILEILRHLIPSQVHSALAYYFDHQDEINADLEEAGNVDYTPYFTTCVF